MKYRCPHCDKKKGVLTGWLGRLMWYRCLKCLKEWCEEV